MACGEAALFGRCKIPLPAGFPWQSDVWTESRICPIRRSMVFYYRTDVIRLVNIYKSPGTSAGFTFSLSKPLMNIAVSSPGMTQASLRFPRQTSNHSFRRMLGLKCFPYPIRSAVTRSRTRKPVDFTLRETAEQTSRPYEPALRTKSDAARMHGQSLSVPPGYDSNLFPQVICCLAQTVHRNITERSQTR